MYRVICYSDLSSHTKRVLLSTARKSSLPGRKSIANMQLIRNRENKNILIVLLSCHLN